MLKRTDILLMLLYVEGKSNKRNETVKGRLKLMKLAFLLKEEEDVGKNSKDFYSFEALNYGPFSRRLMEELNELVQRNLIEEKSREVNTLTDSKMTRLDYKLTKKGIEHIQNVMGELNQEVISKITRIKKKYNKMETERLLTYVYSNYPEFTTKSKIVNDVLA